MFGFLSGFRPVEFDPSVICDVLLVKNLDVLHEIRQVIAVITDVSGLTCKQGKRVNLVLLAV